MMGGKQQVEKSSGFQAMAQATQQQRESEATGQRQMIPRGLRTDGKCAEGGCM